MRLRYLLIAPLALSLALLLPGNAQAGTPRPMSHTSVATSYVVVNGDVAWRIAQRLCGRGDWHTRLTIRSPQGVLRTNHNLIYPRDLVSGSCIAAVAAPRVAASSGGAWRSPLASYTLTSCFGKRWGKLHAGLDMAAPKGTVIRATAAGTVTRTGWLWRGYGISTVIYHGNGVWSHSAHQSATLVRVGQHVAAGQVIGRVGNTGFVVSSNGGDGSHLHFELARAATVLKQQFNPAPWLRDHGVRIGC